MTAGKTGRTCWLVDLENTAGRWSKASRLFQPGDLVAMFWSDKSCVPDVKAMSGVPGVSYMFFECANGTPNAMDFQLSAWLGRASAEYPEFDFMVLSADKGYGPLTEFMAKFGVSVQMLEPELAESAAPPAQPAEQPQAHDPVRDVYIEKIKAGGISDREDIRILSAILMQSMKLPQNMRKLDTRNRLTNRYGAQDGNLRYNAVKDIVHDIAANGPWPRQECQAVTTAEINSALSTGHVMLKTGMASKALNAVKIASACAGDKARRDSLEKSIARIFPLSDRKKAFTALSQFLPKNT